jgi:hypothetical protein
VHPTPATFFPPCARTPGCALPKSHLFLLLHSFTQHPLSCAPKADDDDDDDDDDEAVPAWTVIHPSIHPSSRSTTPDGQRPSFPSPTRQTRA